MDLGIVGWDLQMDLWLSRSVYVTPQFFPCTNHRPPFVLGLAGISMHSICVGIGEDVRAHGGLATVGKTKSQTRKGRSLCLLYTTVSGFFPLSFYATN